jgi:hypothetical protein
VTNEELEAIEARANAATPGPWYVVYEGSSDWEVLTDALRDADGNSLEFRISSSHRHRAPDCPDAAFIAKAREDVPALIAEVRRLRADADRWAHVRDNGMVIVPTLRLTNGTTVFAGNVGGPYAVACIDDLRGAP